MRVRVVLVGVALLAAPAAVLAQADVDGLERAIVHEHNLARQYPDRYAELLEELLDDFQGRYMRLPDGSLLRTREGPEAVREAVEFLRRQTPLGALTLSTGMSRGAAEHVRDQGPAGGLGHEGSDGSHAWDRVNRHGRWNGVIGENLSYGPAQARQVVMGLIIDDGVDDRGHRVNIFKPDFAVAGVACGAHDLYGTMCAIVYASEYAEGAGGG